MSEPNEQNVTCDEKGCGNYFFVTGSCLITDEQLEAVGRALGWVVCWRKGSLLRPPSTYREKSKKDFTR